jgi:hypothetical protein
MNSLPTANEAMTRTDCTNPNPPAAQIHVVAAPVSQPPPVSGPVMNSLPTANEAMTRTDCTNPNPPAAQIHVVAPSVSGPAARIPVVAPSVSGPAARIPVVAPSVSGLATPTFSTSTPMISTSRVGAPWREGIGSRKGEPRGKGVGSTSGETPDRRATSYLMPSRTGDGMPHPDRRKTTKRSIDDLSDAGSSERVIIHSFDSLGMGMGLPSRDDVTGYLPFGGRFGGTFESLSDSGPVRTESERDSSEDRPSTTKKPAAPRGMGGMGLPGRAKKTVYLHPGAVVKSTDSGEFGGRAWGTFESHPHGSTFTADLLTKSLLRPPRRYRTSGEHANAIKELVRSKAFVILLTVESAPMYRDTVLGDGSKHVSILFLGDARAGSRYHLVAERGSTRSAVEFSALEKGNGTTLLDIFVETALQKHEAEGRV